MAASIATSTSSTGAPIASATSRGRGARPSLAGSLPSASLTLSDISWVARGTCTAQPLSRKWRLSSPSIVGTAYLVKALPRSGS